MFHVVHTECQYHLVQAHGTDTLSVPNLFHWNRQRSKETCASSACSYIGPTHAGGWFMFRDWLGLARTCKPKIGTGGPSS